MTPEIFNNKRDGKKSASMLSGVAASLLIHALALWLVLHQAALDMQPMGDETGNRIAVSILPPAALAAPQPVESAPRLAQAAPRVKSSPAATDRKQKKAPARSERKTVDAPGATPPLAKAEPSLPPEQDFSSYLEAARRRRQQADGLSVPEPAETASKSEEPENDNSIAMANIEFSMNRARGKQDNVGGVFQVRRIGYRDAEFMFYGWSEGARKNSTRLITVEQGSYADIQTALIKKVVNIIREEKNGDFLWESRRLGKPVSLSARPQDNQELEQFLMREFFPDYAPASPLG